MRFVAVVAFACVMVSSSGAAAVETCRFIPIKADREACYARQEAELAAKHKAHAPDALKMTNQDPQMKLEDDLVARRLRSICRGC